MDSRQHNRIKNKLHILEVLLKRQFIDKFNIENSNKIYTISKMWLDFSMFTKSQVEMKSKMTKKSHFLVLVFLCCSLQAQIKGVVEDSLTGKPIPYVNIWVENENIGTTSEENGTFISMQPKTENV
jgi:CarboxypepD_reg-like domain